MPRLQADRTKFRWTRLPSTNPRSIAPADGPNGDLPDFTMTPFAPSKMATTGLALMLKAGTTAPVAATPGAGGFSITMWVRDPATLRWAAFAAVSVPYDALFVTYDIDASDIWFQIGNVAVAGAIDIGIAEQ